MTVALEENLGHLSAPIQAAGFRVVPLYGYSGPVDAVVYLNRSLSAMPLSTQNFRGEESGIFMLCARGKSTEEIITMLKERNYGSGRLFGLFH